MGETWTLSRLAASLSYEERQTLLHKLQTQSSISSGPLYIHMEEAQEDVNIQEQYARLPWFYRLWYHFLGLLKGELPSALYEDRWFAEAAHRIEKTAPGIFDFKRGRLLPVFYDQLEKLKEGARFFHAALDAGFNQNKTAFFGFLGSLEMEDIHIRIHAETDLPVLERECPDFSEAEVHKRASQIMEEILEDMTEEDRHAMYVDSRILFCLKELASFSFDRILVAFALDPAAGGKSCLIKLIKESLVSLNNVLYSIKLVPPVPLLQSLFVFLLHETRGPADFDTELQAMVFKAGQALDAIREFNRKVPLTRILRCFFRNMSFCPREISGGENWLSVYREYWKQQITENLAIYIERRKEQHLRDSFQTFLKGTPFRPLAHIATEDNPDGVPVAGAYTLSFLGTFYSVVFIPDMNEILKALLLGGGFTSKEDSAEFTESYNAFFTLEDCIHKFEKSISVNGDIGRRYSQIKQGIGFQPMIKRRKCEIIANEAAAAALGIVKVVYKAAQNIAEFLDRVTGADSRNKYEILANLPRLAVRDPSFMKTLAGMAQKFHQVVHILDDIDALETGK
ncbi:MAG: DUF5312 domain-containing protein [Treponema sp.]|jgi:hypothetical protein|nr:DUF5312 domain-containing protein [Treponema sp.]